MSRRLPTDCAANDRVDELERKVDRLEARLVARIAELEKALARVEELEKLHGKPPLPYLRHR